jgi:hypothetical protein
MKKNTPSLTRVLHDPDVRRRCRLKHFHSTFGDIVRIVALALLSHADVIWKRKLFETSQMIFLGVSLIALSAICYSLAQLRCITKMTDKNKD